MEYNYICTLQADADCKYSSSDKKKCSGNPACAFCADESKLQGRYVRKERWYEKYYSLCR